MKRFRHILIITSLIFGVFLYLSYAKSKVFAAITTEHTVTYNVSPNLETKVHHVINVSYDDKYKGIDKISIEEPTNSIENITKALSNNYTVTSNRNTVEVKFKDLIVGPANFSIAYNYTTNSLIRKVGTTFSLEIPKVSGDEITKYDLKVYLPDNIPLNEFATKLQKDDIGKYLFFTREDLENSGALISFGKEIFFELDVKHIISPDKNYIVIPPTIPERQDVLIQFISKEPTKIYKDSDNNLFFEYETNKSIESVTARYLIRIYGNKSTEKISDFKSYLQPIKNWNFKIGIPLEITKKIQDTTNPIESAFFSTINTLQYNQKSISYNTNLRIGAENLNESNSKNAVCLEYSDLLIAILRGIGIPTREVNGLSYSKDLNYFVEPELHSWVEYYNNGIWTQVDPTFADTSSEDYFSNFDLYHIALLRRSSNSEYPILTGSFAKNNINEQLKISATNAPKQVAIKLKYIDLVFWVFVINDSLSFVDSLPPKSSNLILKSKFEVIKNYSDVFTKVELNRASISEVLLSQKNLFLWLVFCILLSATLFFVAHKKLKKSVKHKKDRVSRIV